MALRELTTADLRCLSEHLRISLSRTVRTAPCCIGVPGPAGGGAFGGMKLMSKKNDDEDFYGAKGGKGKGNKGNKGGGKRVVGVLH